MSGPRSRTDFDVVIVGGGMVGACLGALIAREERLAGWRVAIVEPAVPTEPLDGEVDLRVSALSRASQRILEAADAWGRIESHACAYSEMVVWDAASRAGAGDAVHFSAAETGEPDLGHIVENRRVQWALHTAPLLRNATRIRAGLERLELGGGVQSIELTDGRTVTSSLVVGADGGQSPTRACLGIGRSGWSYEQTAVVAHLRTERPHRATAWQRFLPEGPIALLPLRDGRVSLVWTTTTEGAAALQAATPEEFSRRVAEASDHVLGEMTLDSARAGFPLALWHAQEYVRAGLALVGDAAHTIHPLAGQGVNLGFLDCAALVQVLGEAADAGEELGGLRALRRYERWRRSENALVLATCDGINRLFGARDMAVAAARRLGMAVVGGQGLLRRALVRRALGLEGDLPAIVRRTV